MFIVSVCLRQSPTTLQFMFKEWIGANQFRELLHERRRKTLSEDAVPEDEWSLQLKDDFGHTFDAMIEEIGAIVLKDVAASNKGGQELSMIAARAQAELTAKVQSDPKMRFLAGNIALPQM